MPWSEFLTENNKVSKTWDHHVSGSYWEYICKCLHKRYDYASMEIDEESGLIHGGIQKYIDAHYVCAWEMIWQLLESLLLDHSYSNHYLVAHLSDKQLIYFQEGVEAESVVRKSNSFTLTLTMAWLSHNMCHN